MEIDIGITLLGDGYRMYEDLLESNFELSEEETVQVLEMLLGPTMIH